jgi:hypothetical protein
MLDRQGIPGPGHYQTDLKETLTRVPVWTMGRKSRLGKKMKNQPVIEPKDLIAIDHFVVDLNLLPNPAMARQYAVSHPDLRKLVNELLEAVFDVKPETPLEFLRDYCSV